MSRGMLLAMMAASALGAMAWLNRRAFLQENRRVKQELQRWEGEGGSPTVVSHPAADPDGPGPDIASGTGSDPGVTQP